MLLCIPYSVVLHYTGMITRLLDEMENQGIDELDYPRFETVVCRTLGDIALERSKAQRAEDTPSVRMLGVGSASAGKTCLDN